MRTPGIATFGIRGRADAIPTNTTDKSDPWMTMDPHINQHPSLLRQPVVRGRRFREESHQGVFLCKLVAFSRLRCASQAQTTPSLMRWVRTSTASVARPAEKRHSATEFLHKFVSQRPPRFGRYVTNCVIRGGGTPRGQLRPSFDH
jgi:hypothetical protein